MQKDILKMLSPVQKEISERIMHLALNRIFGRAFASLSAAEKTAWEKTFASDNDFAKEKMVKKHVPDFEKLYIAQLQEITAHIKKGIGKN